MNQTSIGGTKKKVANALAMTGLIIIFIAYMFPFIMVVINSLKQKRDIIKSPFSWLFTIKGLSFDNFVKAFNQMNFLNAFKNSLIQVVTILGLQIGGLLSGSVITETIFSIPGMGRLLVDSIAFRDYPAIQGLLMIFAMQYVLINLVVDMLYGVINPKIRYD